MIEPNKGYRMDDLLAEIAVIHKLIHQKVSISIFNLL